MIKMTNLNAQTQFKIYQIHRMQVLSKSIEPTLEQDDLSEFLQSRAKLYRSVDLSDPNPIVRQNNISLRNFLLDQIESIDKTIKEREANKGPDKDFYSKAIAATVQSLMSDNIYAKTNRVTLTVSGNDADRIGEKMEHALRAFSSANNRPFAMFELSEPTLVSDGADGDKLQFHLGFPGCVPGQELAFDAIKHLRKEFRSELSATNDAGLDITDLISNHDDYMKAMSSEKRNVADSFFSKVSANMYNEFPEVVLNNERFGKVFDKWLAVSHENEEVFDFGMIR